MKLTERQQQVLRMFAEGYSYKDIADQLEVSPSTIQAVRTAIIEKLSATNITHAVVKAIKLRILEI